MKRFPGDPLSRHSHYSGPAAPSGRAEAYSDFSATELYCPKCQMAAPVRERLLLILPDGELYEYICLRCGNTVGEKTARDKENVKIVLA